MNTARDLDSGAAPPSVPLVPADPVAAFRAWHERILALTAELLRVIAQPDLEGLAARAHMARTRRYFLERYPLHMAYLDRALGPRLRDAAPGSAALLDILAREHAEIDVALATLLPLLGAVADGDQASEPPLRAAVLAFSALLLPHVAREERELLPLCAHLSPDDCLAIARELAEPPRAPGRV